MGKIVVLGSINMDLVVTADRFPGPGETIHGTDFARFPGGKGANQAVAAARLGAAVAFVGAVGDDPFGATLTAGLAAEGIDAGRIRVLAGEPTGTAVITVARGENQIIVVGGANLAVSEADGAAVPAEAGDLVVAQLEVPIPAIEAAFRKARGAGAVTILNAAPADRAAARLLPLVDLLVVNEHELALLADQPVAAEDESAVAAACRRLMAAGVRGVVATLGRRGVLALASEATIRREGLSVPVVDTTGAGDCFVGALAAGLARGDDLVAALEIANAAAALSVGRNGAAPSMPTRVQVEDFMAGRTRSAAAAG